MTSLLPGAAGQNQMCSWCARGSFFPGPLRKDPKNHAWIETALGEIDPSDERVFPLLIEAVQKWDANWRIPGELGRCQRRAKEVAPVFVKILESRLDGQLVQPILRALGDMGPEAKPAVPLLRAILRNKSFELSDRYSAAKALGQMGSAAKESLSDLENVKGRDNLGHAAAEAIEKIQND